MLHLISGGDSGGAKTHVFTLLTSLIESIEINVVCFMEGVFYKEIEKMPIPSMLMKQKYRNDLTIIPKLVKHIRKQRYNLIHAHGARANFIALLLRPFIKIPMITTVHSDYRMDFTQNLYKKMVFTELNSFSLRFLDYYIGVSQSFKNMLVGRGFKEDKVYTVYNAIDFNSKLEIAEREAFLKRYNVTADDNTTIVGIIGRFDKVKGHDVFLKAAANVVKEHKNILFLLAGDGTDKELLQNLVKSLGIEKNVMFLGFIKDIYSFINILDINVLSSHSESFPYVLLEGAKLSKATVSTAVGGIPDLIIDEKTGLLADAGDFLGLANQILKFVKDKSLRQQLGKSLFEHASKNFSSKAMKQRHIEIYEDVLKREKAENNLFDVMLSGYYGFNNSGDDAILSAIINRLRQEKPDIKIAVLSKNPKETAEKHNVFSINRINFTQIFKVLPRCRLFLNGGGSLIQDITSTHSLFYYTLLMRFAKHLGLNVMLYANGIGPIIRKSNVKMARNALKICDYITLRDPQSFDELRRLGVENKNVSLSSDPTLAILPSCGKNLEEILKFENISQNKNYFVVSFRLWKYNDFGFSSKMSYIINEISKTYEITPLFVPMQHPYDVILCKEVISKLECEYVLLSKEYDVQELMGIIGISKFVIGMRLHTLIYAVSMGVPIIGIVYDPKIKAFMEYVGQSYYIDSANINGKQLLQMVCAIMEDSTEVRSRIAIESKKLRELSGKDASITIQLLN